MKVTYIIDSKPKAREVAQRLALAKVDKPFKVVADFSGIRTAEQNAKMQAMVRDVARHFGGEWGGRRLSHDEWRHMLYGSFCGQEAVPEFGGEGVVMLSRGTSGEDRRPISAFIEWLYAQGAEFGVEWTQ